MVSCKMMLEDVILKLEQSKDRRAYFTIFITSVKGVSHNPEKWLSPIVTGLGYIKINLKFIYYMIPSDFYILRCTVCVFCFNKIFQQYCEVLFNMIQSFLG